MNSSSVLPTTHRGIWRFRDTIVARQNVAEFPAICVRCGSDNQCRAIRYNLRCKPSRLFLLIPNLAPFSASVAVKPQLCANHLKEELFSRRIGHFMLALALAMMILPIAFMKQAVAFNRFLVFLPGPGFVLLQVWVYYRTFRFKVLTAAEIRGRDAIIKSIPESLKDALPIAQTSTESGM